MSSGIKVVLFSLTISALLGFTQVPIQSAYAAGCTEENIQHWNKIIFQNTPTVTWTADNEPDILPNAVHEVIVQVDSETAPSVNGLISDKLTEIGYFNATTLETPEPENFKFIDIHYQSFCSSFGFAQVVGGALLQPDAATLVLAYGIANSIWIVPSLAGIGIAIYLVKRKF